jgi:ATP-dependent helicase/nuclease subunit B
MTPDVGTLLHEVIELFSKKILEEDINVTNLEKNKCDAIVDEISEEAFSKFRYDIFNSTGKLKNLAIRLKKLIKNMVWIIVLHLKSGKFNLIGSEVEFGRGKELPEIIIDINEKDKVYLFGKIDRVDVANVDGTDYVRIVDYKSSEKAIKLSNVYYGVQLQLLTYSDAVAFNDMKFGGAFYLKLDDPILKTDKRVSKEEVEEQIIKKLRMNGIAISNVKLIKAMDQKLEANDEGAIESDVINLKISKDGNYSKMPIVSDSEFEKLKARIHFLIKSIAKEILDGNVKNEPLNIKGKTVMCSYCNYFEICKFDKCLGNKERRLKELKDDEILTILNS